MITKTTTLNALGVLLAAFLSLGAATANQDIRVDTGGEALTSREIILPLGKAAIVDLPRPAVDVLVSAPNVVDPVIRSPRRIYIMGREPGQANAFFFDAQNNQILNLEIRVEQDADAIRSVVKKLLPDARLDVESLNGNVILHGSVDSPIQAQRAVDVAGRFAGAENVVNMISIREPAQVMLRVRVVEMQRRLVRQLGVDLNGVARVDSSAVEFAVKNSFAVSGGALGGLNGKVTTPGFGGIDNLDFAFDVFEQNGLVKTLAEPNLTAISGENASFLAGGEFPVPQGTKDGVLSIEFKEFGVGLDFLPTVFSKGRIRLRMRTEVSELSATGGLSVASTRTFDDEGNPIEVDGFVVPGVSTRNAETTVELPSGGSIAIAGLLQENISDFVDGVPGIKETPVLGTLFRSQEFLSNQTELVIIATPYLVEPTQLSNLTDPSRGHVSPTVIQSVLLGKLEAAYGVRGQGVGEDQLQGPLGFILD
ncbi:MAG: type II and III secretion system protein family protein [Pseudomonadota bacterium]